MESKTCDQANNSSSSSSLIALCLTLSLSFSFHILSSSSHLYLYLFFLPPSLSHPRGVRVEGECSDITSFNPQATPCCLLIFSYNTHCIIHYRTHSHTHTHIQREEKRTMERREEEEADGGGGGRKGDMASVHTSNVHLCYISIMVLSCASAVFQLTHNGMHWLWSSQYDVYI